jgi:hypothetical protein
MISCAVQSFEALGALRTSITSSFNTTSRHPSLLLRLVSRPQGHICNFYSNIVKDSLQTTSDQGAGADPRQLENTFVLQEQSIDPSYIIGSKPGVSLLVAFTRLALILNSHTSRSTLGAFMPD